MASVKTIAVGGMRFGYPEAGRGPLAPCLHGEADGRLDVSSAPDAARHLPSGSRAVDGPGTSCTWKRPPRLTGSSPTGSRRPDGRGNR